MKTRITRPLLLVLLAGGVSSPVLADCCSSFLGCAATVVTEGVSCEIQTIIDTINGLVNLVKNFSNDITGQTKNAEASARKSVTDTISTMQSQSQQSDADLAAALSQAQALHTQEDTIIAKTATIANTQNLQSASPSTLSTQPRSQTAQVVSEKTPNGAPLAMTAQHSQALVPASASSTGQQESTLQKSSVTAGTQVAASNELTSAPHGTYADAFSRGVKQIAALKSSGDTDFSKVNQYLTQAQNSEGPGVAAADTLAGVMNAPLTNIESELSSMLSNPLNAFDPTSAVDAIENAVTADVSANISQMIADITTGPDQAFNAAQPTYDDLLATAESAQAIATAMANLYRLRSTAAATALYALLPIREFSNTSKATVVGTSLTAKFGQRLSFAKVSAQLTDSRKTAIAAFKQPNVAQIHAAVAQFKAQRAQGKSALPQSTLLTYKTSFSGQLNAYFNNKSAAAIATQRDQLIAQARTKFAKDPTTENGVISLITSEAAKRSTATNATTTNAAVPGQPVPTLASQSAATTNPKQQDGVVAPVNPPVSQTKATTWGATPAWTPPAAASGPAMTSGASSTLKARTTLKTVQPIQQQTQQPAALQTAPSSLGR
jgi:hypothetical protein